MGRAHGIDRFREGALPNGQPYLAFGEGPPLVVLRGFQFSHDNPSGRYRELEARAFRGIARERSVYLVNRRPGLPAGSTMAGIATSHAEALRQRFGTAVDVLGVSTGGSIALQLAVDHPQVVRRLLVVASAYRLPERARREQAELADRLASGRRALQLLANELATRTIARLALRGVLWLLAPRVQPKDPGDAIAVLRAEDGFDVGDRLPEITAPTIVIGGGRDAAYGVDMFRRTAEDIPDARLVLYPQRGHVGTLSDPRFTEDVRGFLR